MNAQHDLLIKGCHCCQNPNMIPATIEEIRMLVHSIRPDATVTAEDDLYVVRQPGIKDKYGFFKGRPIWHWIANVAHLEAFLNRVEQPNDGGKSR